MLPISSEKNGQRRTFDECNPFCNAIKKLQQLPLSNMKMSYHSQTECLLEVIFNSTRWK